MFLLFILRVRQRYIPGNLCLLWQQSRQVGSERREKLAFVHRTFLQVFHLGRHTEQREVVRETGR